MGDTKKYDLRVSFDSRLKLKLCGSKVTSDAGLLAYRELDEVLSLTEMGAEVLSDSRLGTNKQHCLVPTLRQSKYVTFQLAEVAVTRNLFAEILDRIERLALPPPVVAGCGALETNAAGMLDAGRKVCAGRT